MAKMRKRRGGIPKQRLVAWERRKAFSQEIERRAKSRAAVKRAIKTLQKQEPFLGELFRFVMERCGVAGGERKRWVSVLEEIAVQNQFHVDAQRNKTQAEKRTRELLLGAGGRLRMEKLGFSIGFGGCVIRFSKELSGWMALERDPIYETTLRRFVLVKKLRAGSVERAKAKLQKRLKGKAKKGKSTREKKTRVHVFLREEEGGRIVSERRVGSYALVQKPKSKR